MIKKAWTSIENLKSMTSKKKLIFWGKSLWVDKTIQVLNKKADFIIDSNNNNNNTTYLDIKVFSPDKLKKIDKKNYIIIITTGNFESVTMHLDPLEFKEGKDYYITPFLSHK